MGLGTIINVTCIVAGGLVGLLGRGCLLAALPVAVLQGSVTALAHLLEPVMTAAALGNLYAFWGDALYEALARECDLVVNVASVEYARAVTRWVRPGGPQVLTCLFGTMREGRLRQAATEAKAARGTFIRWCAERGAQDPAELEEFDQRGYALDRGLSDEGAPVFVRATSSR